MESICCIDDHDGCRTGIIDVLTELGYNATPFRTVEEFLESGQSFDQIILDVHLPGQSGLELLADLRASGDNTPVIIYSGSITPEEAATASRITNVSVLDKPFKIGELVKRLV